MSSDDGLFLRRVSLLLVCSWWCCQLDKILINRETVIQFLGWGILFIYHTNPLNALAVSSAEEDCYVQEDVPQEDRVGREERDGRLSFVP